MRPSVALVESQPEATPAVSNVIELPVRRGDDGRDTLSQDVVLTLATADDLASGIGDVVERIRRSSGAAGAEWWSSADDGALDLVAATGVARGRRSIRPVDGAGLLVLHGGRLDTHLESVLASLAPIIRRRAAEERLARTAIELARRNEALEDFAALVAHELKTPLHAALVADDPSALVEDALSLVERLLEASRDGSRDAPSASAAACLDQVVEDLRAGIDVTADIGTTLPLPPGPLRVILRNLLANAAAAGARHVHVAAARSSGSWQLLVDDDGVGLANVDSYAAGSGLGLSLCRRIASRFGGVLELVPRSSGGTRAILAFGGAPQ
jgi:signal transduction histidine kinase